MDIVDVTRTFDEIDWLRGFLGNPESLDNESTIRSVLRFSLMWNIFEAKVCGTEATIAKIEAKVNDILDQLTESDFLNYYNYFKNRYVSDGKTNERFEALRFRRRDNEKKIFVSENLVNGCSSVGNMVKSILIIIYRYRNNLFHGTKDVRLLHNQENNFKISNEAIAKFLECARRAGALEDL